MSEILACLFLGIVVGTTSSLFALGGGAILVPFLPLLLGFSTFQAAATSLFTVFIVALVNTIGFSRHKLVRWSSGFLIGIPAGITALASGYLAVKAGERAVQLVVLAVLIFIMISTFLRRHHLRSHGVAVLSKAKKIAIAVTGGFIGFLSAFSGLGGGALTAPLLINLRMVTEDELVPTANLSTCITTFTGCLGYFLLQRGDQQFVDFPVALGIFSVATVTSHFVRPLQRKLPGSVKITVVCAILAAVILQQSYQILRDSGYL